MDRFNRFEKITRKCGRFSDTTSNVEGAQHPFSARSFHPAIFSTSKKLFDDGHYKQATTEVFILIEDEIRKQKELTESGWKLMMAAFDSQEGKALPKIALTSCADQSEIDYQEGFKFVFGGSMRCIRNPRAHKSGWIDQMDTCLDNLSFASLLIKELEKAGLIFSNYSKP